MQTTDLIANDPRVRDYLASVGIYGVQLEETPFGAIATFIPRPGSVFTTKFGGRDKLQIEVDNINDHRIYYSKSEIVNPIKNTNWEVTVHERRVKLVDADLSLIPKDKLNKFFESFFELQDLRENTLDTGLWLDLDYWRVINSQRTAYKTVPPQVLQRYEESAGRIDLIDLTERIIIHPRRASFKDVDYLPAALFVYMGMYQLTERTKQNARVLSPAMVARLSRLFPKDTDLDWYAIWKNGAVNVDRWNVFVSGDEIRLGATMMVCALHLIRHEGIQHQFFPTVALELVKCSGSADRAKMFLLFGLLIALNGKIKQHDEDVNDFDAEFRDDVWFANVDDLVRRYPKTFADPTFNKFLNNYPFTQD